MTFSLYPFQREDIEKIARQKAGLIGSEMGTGKTHEAIALDEAWHHLQCQLPERDRVPPTLVIAPLNTFDSWQEKYAIQSPESDVYTIDRKNRDGFTSAIQDGKADVYLMHWDALRLLPDLTKVQFNTVVADEVHRIANRKAQVTRALKKLRTNHKLGLSGTATGDKPENLWSILNWLYPTYYKSYWHFVKYYVVYEMQPAGYNRVVGVKNTHVLKREMSPWYVRHLKRDTCCEHHPDGVMQWLPEKTYETVWVDLSPTQRRVYNQMRDNMVAWVGEHEETPLTATAVVAQLTRLSQIAIATPHLEDRWVKEYRKDPRTGERETVEVLKTFVNLELPSSKIDRVLEILEDQPDKQFVIFTSSKKAAYLCQEGLTKKKIVSEVLSGDTPQVQREGMKERFRSKKTRVWVGVIQAGGEGIDYLQECTDTVIFLDRTWSAWRNKQAEDRLHRGGQKDTVEVIDIMARDTIDMGRHQKLELKWAWIRKILGDEKP